MGLNYARLFASNSPSLLKTNAFGGITQAADENDLRISPSCFTQKALNFWIDRGNLTARHNYEPVTPSGISVNNDGYTYKIKSMFVHAAAVPILLAGCEVYPDAAMMPPAHHCALLKRKLDLSDNWAVVTCALRRSFGTGLDFYFQNAGFTFTNYSGDFYEDGSEVFATILANGVDMPMFFMPDGLSVLKSDGWFSTNVSTGSLTSSGTVAVGDTLQFFSRTLAMPRELSVNTNYYVLTVDGTGTFTISATRNGSALSFDISGSANFNLMSRVVSETSDWVLTSADYKANSFHAINLAHNGDTVEFRSTSFQMPKGLAAGKLYYVINKPLVNKSDNDFFQICTAKGGSSATVCADSSSADTLTISLQRSFTGTMTVRLQNSSDNILRVTKDNTNQIITISLANMTASYNTADKIQAAIQGLQTVGSAHVDFATCTAGGNWNTAAIATGMNTEVAFSHVNPLEITSNGANLYARLVNAQHDDAPIGSNIFVHSDRLWMNVGNTLYHNAGYYDGAAHPADWEKDGYAGNIPIPTWDGDVIRMAKTENGKPWVCKENSVWSIDGYAPPYTVRQLFTAKGTIAPHSVAWYTGCLFYAAEEGILQFDGAATKPYLTTEIQKLWYPRNTFCICNVVGDTLFVHGQFYHPFNKDGSGNPALGPGLMMVDIPTKNICFQDMSLDGTTLSCQCVLDPPFTTLQPDTTQSFHWFASGSKIYRYSPIAPATGAAPAMKYCIPQSDFGTASYKKDVSWLTLTGCGGACKITPVVDGLALVSAPYPYAAMLPAAAGIVDLPISGVTGRLIGWIIENVSGSGIEIHDLEVTFGRSHA